MSPFERMERAIILRHIDQLDKALPLPLRWREGERRARKLDAFPKEAVCRTPSTGA